MNTKLVKLYITGKEGERVVHKKHPQGRQEFITAFVTQKTMNILDNINFGDMDEIQRQVNNILKNKLY